jgi:CRISPR type III-B/RAMP module RAMP protein Cmr6
MTMPSLLRTTAEALGGEHLPKCQSRSLRLTRYARPELNDKSTPTRQEFLKAVVDSHSEKDSAAAASYLDWCSKLRGCESIIARLQSRLLINVAGSVMENAGLNLDRYGIAYIPGSAVKGCARRAALATLRQWTETGVKPAGGDCLAPAAAPFTDRQSMLLAIVRVFGCTDLEWSTAKTNDLEWSCGNDWETLSLHARRVLNQETGSNDSVKPNRRGAVAFLPAYPADPQKMPPNELELDVLTPHHKEYYGSEKLTVALDNENPVPVYFPAIAAGLAYRFTLVPLIPSQDSNLVRWAALWLSTGIQVLGLGAKTAAGYGWFQDLTEQIRKEAAKKAAAEAEARRKQEEEDKRKREREAKEEQEAHLASLPKDQRADAELKNKAANKGTFNQHLIKFATLDPEQQAAIVRWLATTDEGKAYWLDEIKDGKRWRPVISTINRIKKELKLKLP